MALLLEAHCISTVKAGTSSEIPAFKAISLVIFPPVPMLFPQIISSIFLILYFSIKDFKTSAPKSSGKIFLYIPFSTPI